jgi:hypothetical protein
MRTVQIYINDKILDLFDDENIVVNSTIQNVSDIAKVFTDFSQQFTVPATKRNNDIFQHYYNNDVDGTFQAKERQPARIDINFTPFRKGKIQLEGAQIVQNQAQHYVITFYGDVVSLKDLFGDDKLRDLDYTDLEALGTYTEVKNSITSTASLDVRYPLISSDRVWQYGGGGGGGGGGSNNISASGGAINFGELFPAVRTAKVLELIEEKYGVTFDGNFLTDTRFTNLYTWWKNSDVFTAGKAPKLITWNSFSPSPPAIQNTNQAGLFNNTRDLDYNGLADNKIRFKYFDIQEVIPTLNPINYQYYTCNIQITATNPSTAFVLNVHKNGFYQYQTGVFTGNVNFPLAPNYLNQVEMNDYYEVFIKTNAGDTFNYNIAWTLQLQGVLAGGNLFTSQAFQQASGSLTTTQFIDFNNTAPDILVSDYFSGLLRMFNLTCYPLDAELTFQVEPLELWYRYGLERNITPFVDVKNIKVDRPKLYNNIEFNYQSSKSFMNVVFKENNNKEYGSLRNYFGYDGGDFKIDLPFETLLFQKFTGENLQVGYSLETEPDNKPVVPKCTQLYFYPVSKSVSFYLTDGSSPEEITTYRPFGQDTFYNNDEYTINFNEEFSSLTLDPEPNSLYRTYYQEYLTNLFSDKTRIVTVKCILPLPLLQNLELNDALIIRDKKYRINEQKINLTNGEVELVLITDSSVRRQRVIRPVKPIPIGGGNIVFPVKPIKKGKVEIKKNGVLQPKDYEDEENILFSFPANTTGDDITTKFTFLYYDENGDLSIEEDMYITQLGSEFYLLKEDDSFLLQENLFKIFL